MNNDELEIIASIDDGIAPHDWRNDSSWFGGKMVKPIGSEALEYCVLNGTYFDAPNAYFIEGFEDGDCECEVLGVGNVPCLGDLTQDQLSEIWSECFKPVNAEPSASHLEFLNGARATGIDYNHQEVLDGVRD